jgi:hypothetical protein
VNPAVAVQHRQPELVHLVAGVLHAGDVERSAAASDQPGGLEKGEAPSRGALPVRPGGGLPGERAPLLTAVDSSLDGLGMPLSQCVDGFPDDRGLRPESPGRIGRGRQGGTRRRRSGRRLQSDRTPIGTGPGHQQDGYDSRSTEQDPANPAS